MKVFATLTTISFVAFAYATSTGLELQVLDDAPKVDCPANNGENATVLPNPDDCKTFYICETGVPLLKECPPGLHFDAKESVCNWPALACCDPAVSDPEKCKAAE